MEFIITEEEINNRVKELANKIQGHYKNKYNVEYIYFILILTSSFIFASDLMRNLSKLSMKLKTDVISIKSYVGIHSGPIQAKIDDIYRENLNNKHVLVVDDILDTGATLNHVHKQILNSYTPKTLDFCCLLKKQNERRKLDFNVKFVGFEIPDFFIVGYGLDHNGDYRELPYLISLEQIQKIK